MAARSPAAAVAEFKGGLQRVLACVSTGVLVVSRSGYRAASEPHQITLAGDSVRLPGVTTVLLSLRYGYLPVSTGSDRGSWEVRVTSYYLGLADAGGREVVAYHWHPHIAQSAFPHRHLGPGAAIGRPELSTAHLPTGHVELRDVARLAVRDFGVTPLRDDWQDVLAAGG